MQQSTRSGLRVFATVLSFFVIVVVLTGAAITILNYVQTRQAALSVAADTLEATVLRISEQRQAFFGPVRLLVMVYSDDPRVIAGGDQVGAILAPLLNALEQSPQVASLYVGYDTGDFFRVMQFSEREKDAVAGLGGPPESRFALQTIRRDPSGSRVETWQFMDARRAVVGRLRNDAPAYDPRQRGWYIEAVAEPGTIGRTPPYAYAATRQVGLTLARSIGGPAGGAVGATSRSIVCRGCCRTFSAIRDTALWHSKPTASSSPRPIPNRC